MQSRALVAGRTLAHLDLVLGGLHAEHLQGGLRDSLHYSAGYFWHPPLESIHREVPDLWQVVLPRGMLWIILEHTCIGRADPPETSLLMAGK